MDIVQTLLVIMLVCLIVGVALFAINKFVPMEPNIKSIMNSAVAIVLVLFLLLWLISMVGGFPHLYVGTGRG